MRPCFTLKAATATKPAVLALDEEIGFWGVQARDFRNQIDAVTGDLEVEINSPGGDVMAGLGMYNMLRNHAAKGHKVTTRVSGVAASIASIIMLAGDNREMPSNAFAMVHAVKGGAWGTAEEIRDQAEVIDKVQASLRNIYVNRMGVDEAKATEIMAKDTWLNADECLEMGFVTAVVDPIQATAKFDMGRAELPEHVAKVFAAKADPQPEPEPEITPEPEPTGPLAESIVAKAKEFGLEAHAKHFALTCDTIEAATNRMGTAREIVALCNVVGRPDDAAALISNQKTVAEARAALTDALAETDEHVNTTPVNSGKTNGDPAKPTVVSPTELWALHNKAKGR